MKTKQTKQYYHCPECDGTEILVYEETCFLLLADNDFEHYCNSVKLCDSDAKARCNDCNWVGVRQELISKES